MKTAVIAVLLAGCGNKEFAKMKSKDDAGINGIGGPAPSGIVYIESYPGELRDKVRARMEERKLELAGTGLVEFAEEQREQEK